AARELLRQGKEVEGVALLERRLADLVLLCMVNSAKADRPAIRGLETRSAVGAGSHMCALDRKVEATRYAAVVPSDPGPVRGKGAVLVHPARPRYPLRQSARHEPPP